MMVTSASSSPSSSSSITANEDCLTTAVDPVGFLVAGEDGAKAFGKRGRVVNRAEVVEEEEEAEETPDYMEKLREYIHNII